MSIKPAFNTEARGPKSADRTAWKKRLDLVLYLLFCSLAGTGFLLAYRFPHGPGAGSLLFMGLHRHEWGDIHTWLAYAVIGVATVHLLLNWRWLVKVAGSNSHWRLVAGIVTGLLIVGIFIFLPIDQPAVDRPRNPTADRGPSAN